MINETRQLIADALKPSGFEVWHHEPSDVTSVPCIVIGRPSMEVSGNLYTISCPVWILGRRIGDQDSAIELDTVTDRAIELLRAEAVVTALTPLIRTVAELTYPAYRIDCVTGQGMC